MAIQKNLFDPTGSGSKGTKTCATYGTGTADTDTRTQIKAAGYFNSLANEFGRVGFITIFASDATFQAKVTVAAGVVTLAAVDAF